MILPSTQTKLFSSKMDLPGKPLRPLKKRRITTVDPPDDLIGVDEVQGRTRNTKTVKRRKTGAVTPSPPSSPIRMKKSVRWGDRKTVLSSFNPGDLWYTADNYNAFMLDRISSIEAHRSTNHSRTILTNDDNNSFSRKHCIRGLEAFQENDSNKIYNSRKKLHYSTIFTEQARQKMMGINKPERYRSLVALRSDMALRRAQELAAHDEREVYAFRTRSSMSQYSSVDNPSNLRRIRMQELKSIPNDRSALSDLTRQEYLNSNGRSTLENGVGSIKTRHNFSPIDIIGSCDSSVISVSTASSIKSMESESSADSLFSEKILELQQRNARRLMEIYYPNRYQTGEDDVKKLFRFSNRQRVVGVDIPSGTRCNPIRAAPSTFAKSTVGVNTPFRSNAMTVGDTSNEITSSAKIIMMEMQRRRRFQENFQQQLQEVHELTNTRPIFINHGSAESNVTRNHQLTTSFFESSTIPATPASNLW